MACFNLYECCSEHEIEDTLRVSDPRTEAQCLDDVTAICKRNLARFNFSLDNKHVRFDGKLMDACLEAFVAPEGSCRAIDTVTPWTEACMENAWVGIVANGGACDFAYECEAGSFCNPSRVCTALPTDGMKCTNEVPACASGLFCDLGTCRPLRGAGVACTPDTQCVKGLFCDLAAATPVCTAKHGTGEACSGAASCESDNCLPGTCTGTQNSCTTDQDCGGACADSGMFCTVDSNCSSGTCSGTATPCASQTQCTTPGSTCVFAVKCVFPPCVGTACADDHIEIDYCTAVNELPLFRNGNN
ncbi:MAG TPA: hypothetical protein VK607_09395 [Kofleriaceae bacterium]|nr:hypothetical protein [Kofleriaceae bacterium]